MARCAKWRHKTHCDIEARTSSDAWIPSIDNSAPWASTRTWWTARSQTSTRWLRKSIPTSTWRFRRFRPTPFHRHGRRSTATAAANSSDYRRTITSNSSRCMAARSTTAHRPKMEHYSRSLGTARSGILFCQRQMVIKMLNWQSDKFNLSLQLDSSTIHLSKCRPAISEDETIMEDSSIVSKSNANTIQRNPHAHSQKIATVLRNRSSYYREREILSKSLVIVKHW